MDQEDIQMLTELGLTGSQARVYLALAQLEKANARTLWKASKVSRQDIYRLLTDLREIGLIEKILATPTEFKAIPIEDGISILIERRTKEVLDMRKKAEKVIQKFKNNNLRMTLEEEVGQYILIPEKEPLTIRLKKAIATTQKSADIITSQKAFAKVLFALNEDFKKALRRGVKIRWIIDQPKDANSWPEFSFVQVLMKNPKFKLRTILQPPHVRLGIYDKKEVFLATFPKRAGLESPALWSSNTSFAAIIDNFFETMWSTACARSMNTNCALT